MIKDTHCEEFLTQLSEFVDGDIEDQQLCQEIETHLQDCENCQIMVDTLKKTIFLYHTSAKKITLPHEVRKRLFQKLDLETFLE